MQQQKTYTMAIIFAIKFHPMNLDAQDCSRVSYRYLSYDVAVIQWITSGHKNHMTKLYYNIFARTSGVIDNVRVNSAFLEILFILKEIKSNFRESDDHILVGIRLIT